MIRENLELLCRGLTTSGTTKITAELFRQAKFNKHEAVQPFWILLYELLHFRYHSEFPTKGAREALPIQDVVTSVKHQLYTCGYRATFLLTPPTAEFCESRELLLALAWMIAKYNIIDKLMANRQGLADDFLHNLRNSDHGRPNARSQPGLTQQKVGDLGNFAKYLLWLHGRLQLNLRGLYSMEVEKQNISHRVHKSTQGVSTTSSSPHLSSEETYLLRYPKHLHKFYDFVEAENNRLQCLVKWKESEDVFWKWMESVIEAKFQDGASESQTTGVFTYGDVTMTTDSISYQLMDLHSDLAVELNDCHGNAAGVDRLARNKIAVLAQKHVMDYSLKEIEIDVLDCIDQYPRKPKVTATGSSLPKYLLRGKMSTPNKQKNYKELEKQKAVGNISTKIENMREVKDQLLMDLEAERSKHGQILSSLAEQLGDVVCIPPLSRK